jgi:hypothetical protein
MLAAEHLSQPPLREVRLAASANEAFVRRAVEEIWNRGDLDVADELFAMTYVNHQGLITDLVRGPEAVKVSAAMFRVAYPELHVTVDEVTVDTEDTVVLRWTALRTMTRGTPECTAGTVSQTLLTGITRGRFASGRIVESWTEW